MLLFDGTGTSPGDVAAIQSLLADSGLAYDTAGSWRLDRMSEAELAAHRLVIVHGGDFMVMGKNLKGTTGPKIRTAVQNGLGYLGICAGALMAADSPDYNGFNLTGGVRFGFYADVNLGTHKDSVAIAGPHEAPLDQYWEDGPQLAGWGDVVAKYPDGTPAIAEGAIGRGWAILSGVRPEAPESWRRGMTFATPASGPRLCRDPDLGGSPADRATAFLIEQPEVDLRLLATLVVPVLLAIESGRANQPLRATCDRRTGTGLP